MIHIHTPPVEDDVANDPGSRKLAEKARTASKGKSRGVARCMATQPGSKVVHTATAEKDYTLLQVRFLRACDERKRELRRVFLTLTEVVEVAESMGWQRPTGTWPEVEDQESRYSVAS